MPKIKTHKGMSKRIKITKSGKLMRLSARISHLQTKKSKTARKRHQGYKTIDKSDRKNVKKLI